MKVIDDYQLKAWLPTLRSPPAERIAHGDHSASYEVDEAHVFSLENGQFAMVVECGCSCYSSSDADIDLFPDKESAMKQFDKWESEHKR